MTYYQKSKMTLFISSTPLYYYCRMFSIPLKCILYLLYTLREVFIWRINYCYCHIFLLHSFVGPYRITRKDIHRNIIYY